MDLSGRPLFFCRLSLNLSIGHWAACSDPLSWIPTLASTTRGPADAACGRPCASDRDQPFFTATVGHARMRRVTSLIGARPRPGPRRYPRSRRGDPSTCATDLDATRIHGAGGLGGLRRAPGGIPDLAGHDGLGVLVSCLQRRPARRAAAAGSILLADRALEPNLSPRASARRKPKWGGGKGGRAGGGAGGRGGAARAS